MKRFMLKSKIQRPRITGLALEYEGSITLDPELLEAADLLPGEQVHVLNENNGARLTTYTISGEPGSGKVLLNGPAARLGMPGDAIVILSYCTMETEEARSYVPRVVTVDEKNAIRDVANYRPGE
jgi:aspartate 1-decarboxylase